MKVRVIMKDNRFLIRLLIVLIIVVVCMVVYPYFYCQFTFVC